MYILQATSTQNGKQSPALVDMWLVDPDGATVHHHQGVREAEDSLFFHGPHGPWELCFKQRTADGLWRPSAQIHLTFFDVTDSQTPGGTNLSKVSQASASCGPMGMLDWLVSFSMHATCHTSDYVV
jgi:hypothetical protein